VQFLVSLAASGSAGSYGGDIGANKHLSAVICLRAVPITTARTVFHDVILPKAKAILSRSQSCSCGELEWPCSPGKRAFNSC
jgi:hypothetical protein